MSGSDKLQGSRELGAALVRGGVLLMLGLAPAACSAPFGARQASPEAVRRELTANVLSSGEPSRFSEILLHRQNLNDLFDDDREAALRVLHERFCAGELADDGLFSLSELSFYHAGRAGSQRHYLAAALYAYAYAFPDQEDLAPDRFDPRLRYSVELYNRALTEALKSAEGTGVVLAEGTFPLPFGEMEVSFDAEQLRWGDRRLVDFVSATETEVTGFENRYRSPGVGAALAAATEPTEPDGAIADLVGREVHVPVTALLKVPHPRRQLTSGEALSGRLELHAASLASTAEIGAWTVPLEREPTVALGLTVTEARPWVNQFSRFLGHVVQSDTGSDFAGYEAHRKGRIPVVFVHGTASNPSVWFNMMNDLDSDPVIRERFEFYLFWYDSGQPILYSGMQLRRSLTEAWRVLHDELDDSCLDRMVVIGHSQGGLLVKLTAIDSGDRFWRNLSDGSLEDSGLSAETQALIEEMMFVEPLPFVRRVVFIATPHRGSYLAGPSIVRRLAERLISTPASLVRSGGELLGMDKVRQLAGIERLPTSIDNMSPGHPFIAAIAGIPVVPEITAHSIVGVVGEDPLESGGDGVVKYTSAHIDGVESELIVPYPHSMQAKPEVVQEVQRILHHHLEVDSCGSAAIE